MYAFNKQNPFTKLQIKSIAGLHGHGLKLYPLLVQNEYRFNFDIAIDDLKDALNIDLQSYNEYKEFKKYVLKPHIDLINLKTELSVQYKAAKKDGRKASHVNFTVTKKRTVKAEQPQETVQEKPSSKIRSIDIYQAILKNNMLDRFKQVNESSEEFINRIRLDLKSNNAEIWIKKLAEFNVYLDEPPF